MERIGYIGATWVFVGTSAALYVTPPGGCVGGWLQQNTAGTLWLGAGLSQIPGASGMMWVNTTNAPLEWDGPARFFLYASGATVGLGIGFKYSVPGISSPIAGG